MKPIMDKQAAIALIVRLRDSICASLINDYSFDELIAKVRRGIAQVFYWAEVEAVAVYELIAETRLSVDLIYSSTPNVIRHCFAQMYAYARAFGADSVICKPDTAVHERLYRRLGFDSIDNGFMEIQL